MSDKPAVQAKVNFDKKLINFIPGDIDTIREHYPDISYNGIVRTVIHAYAEGLRSGRAGSVTYDPQSIKISEP